MAKKFLDTDHPVFRRLWVRIAVVVVPGLWALVEFATGNGFWGVLFLGLAGYAGWMFFLDPNRKLPD